jgi:small-conductance mechanosensitive channel
MLAWALGYVVAATATGPFGEVAIRQTLYLNAFLAVEMIKVAVRLVVSPSARDLRPLAISDAGATRLYRILNLSVSIFGYGLLLLVPIINANASFAAGRSLSALVGLLTALVLAMAIVRNRVAVADWLVAQGRKPLPPAAPAEPDALRPAGLAAPPDVAAPEEEDASAIVIERDEAGRRHLAEEPRPKGVYATLARNWHWAALLWLGWLLVTMLARSEDALYGATRLSLTVGGGVVLAVILSGALGRAFRRGVSLPAGLNERLPRLQPRLNGFVPQLLIVLRVVVVVAVLLAALWLGGAVDLGAWLATPLGIRLAGTILSVVAILAAAFLIWLALTSWVEYRLNPDFGKAPTARERTLLTLLRNAASIALLVVTLMFALSELGLNIGPLIASAGVIGLAIGFGAQKLVQDVITGVFIQLENAMNVGDIVTAGTTTGVVEKLTIRSVSLRDVNGIYHLIPFSSVDAVSNFSRDFSNYVVDMGVAYREDTGEVKQAMFDAFDELKRHPEQGVNVIGDFEWFGIERFADSAVILRGRIRTLPGKQWGVGRAYNEVVKRIFDARGIEIPFPHTTLYWGENKKGETQPIRLRTETE